MLQVILLEGWTISEDALSLRSSSCSPGGRKLVPEFATPIEKGVRSLTLKELLPKYVLGKSNS